MEDVFVPNGFENKKVQEYMKESKGKRIKIKQKNRDVEEWWLCLMYLDCRNSLDVGC